MSEVIMIVSPGKWVSEEQLIALKGIKGPGKIVYGRKGI
ncbi:putative phage excisionase protein [Escherichia coli PA7]|nr:putative phage excisionase protein [Escherichia coli PA7]